MNSSNAEKLPKQVVQVPRYDRWLIHQRLQELSIPCECLPDGSFQVDVQTPIAAMQVHSVIRQFTAPRQVLIQWLNRCWQAD